VSVRIGVYYVDMVERRQYLHVTNGTAWTTAKWDNKGQIELVRLMLNVMDGW